MGWGRYTPQTLPIGQCLVEIEFALVISTDSNDEACSILYIPDSGMRKSRLQVVVARKGVVVVCIVSELLDVSLRSVNVSKVLRVPGRKGVLDLVDGCLDGHWQMLEGVRCGWRRSLRVRLHLSLSGWDIMVGWLIWMSREGSER